MVLSPLRKGRVTGSVAGAILGYSPFMTPDDVMRSMVREYHGAPSEFTGNVATDHGNFHEPGAIFDYELETGRIIKESQFYMFEDWLGATPDGEIDDEGLAEIKCPYGKRNDPAPVQFKTLDEQLHYHAQTQIEMLCAVKSWTDFFQWTPNDTALERVHIDFDWLDENLPKLKAFHNQFLIEVKNPQKYLDPKRKEYNGADLAQMLTEYDEVIEMIDRATEKKKDIIAAIANTTKNESAIICGRNFTKVEKSGSISYAKAIKDLVPDADLEPYRGKGSVYWKLT